MTAVWSYHHRITGASPRCGRGSAIALFSIVAVATLAGCGGSGSAANKTKFCQDTATLANATAPVGTPDTPEKDAQILKIFKDIQATINDLVKTAPSDIKTDAQLLVETINAAIKADSMNNFGPAGGTGQRMATYCGLNGDGTPIGSTP
jgi:hypothetical protein